MKRRSFLQSCATAAVTASHAAGDAPSAAQRRVTGPRTTQRPVIDVTDLYHPHQDRGDNFDLIAAYGLSQVDLRAVIFDVTDRFRRPFRNPDGAGYDDATGPREPGFIPVQQLNTIFDRAVPCACAPFGTMRDPEDPMNDTPTYQQAGIDLIVQVLRESKSPVDIVSFGSARPIAVAYNRQPHLLREKVRRIHLCAGTAPRGYLEWNVALDPHAFVRLLRSDLPVAVYPCATPSGPTDVGRHNTYWSLPDLQFVRTMTPALQRYIEYAFSRSNRQDFLTLLDEPAPIADMSEHFGRTHHVWETAVWMEVADLRLVRRPDNSCALLPADDVPDDAVIVPQALRPVRVTVDDDGQFDFEFISDRANILLYDRTDAHAHEAALRLAFPAWYRAMGTGERTAHV